MELQECHRGNSIWLPYSHNTTIVNPGSFVNNDTYMAKAFLGYMEIPMLKKQKKHRSARQESAPIRLFGVDFGLADDTDEPSCGF